MPLLLLVLLVGVLLYLWLSRRNSTLTAACKWRLDRSLGADSYRCATCGAVVEMGAGKQPRQCLAPGA
jgi:hypothetical protein